MLLGGEQIADGVIAKLKAEWNSALAEVEAATSSHPSPLVLPRVDLNYGYSVGDKLKWEFFPSFNVSVTDEIPGDENSQYEWVKYPITVWYVDEFEDEQILARRVWRAARAFRNIFADDESGRGPDLDGYATGVIRCGLLQLSYGQTVPGGDPNVFLQGFVASLAAEVEETR